MTRGSCCYGIAIIVVGSAGGGIAWAAVLAGLPLPLVLVDPVERVDAPPLPPPPPQADRIAALMAVKMMVLILVLIADILSPFLLIGMVLFIKWHKVLS